jgi:starch synthase
MQIAMISAECAPVAKAGGLGDFVEGLSRDLTTRGHQVEIILPKYDSLRFDRIWDLHKVQDLWAPLYGDWVHCNVEQGHVDGLSCWFIDPQCPQEYFQRGRIHGEPDDADRFAFFSRAALEFLYKSGRQPDILHCHDWHTGLVPVLLHEIYEKLGWTRSRVCYTLHNLAHQGRSAGHVLRLAGLDPEALMTVDRLGDSERQADCNLMKGGIVYSDYVTTVSPRYAWEVTHTDLGNGMQPTLKAHAHKFGGVLNGIDYEVWNPQTDPLIAETYCDTTLQRKARNKAALRDRLQLEQAFRPIVAVVSRLDEQKGPHLIRHALQQCLEQEAQFVLLGEAQDAGLRDEFRALKLQLANNPHCHLELEYDDDLAHRVFAGADILLMPSRFEPCGLSQMIAMRYGVVPVVHRTGGLADTVFDANYSEVGFTQRNGYAFTDYSPQGLADALQRAIGLWFGHPDYFRQLRLNGMRQDHSWRVSGERYQAIYRRIAS